MASLKNTNKVSPTLLYMEITSFHIGNWWDARRGRCVPHIASIWAHREEGISQGRELPARGQKRGNLVGIWACL